MKRIFFIAFFLASIVMFAQNHYIGIKAGANFSNVSFNTDPIVDDFNSRTGVVAGLTYDYYFLKFLCIGAELAYEQRGYNLEVNFTNEIGEEIGEGKINYNYDYIKIPLKAGVIFGKRFSFFANIGVVPAVNVISKWKVPIDVQGQSEKDTKDKVNDFDFAGMAEIGAVFSFLGRFQAFVSFAYQHSFTGFNNSEYHGDLKMMHYGFSVAGGIKYALKK